MADSHNVSFGNSPDDSFQSEGSQLNKNITGILSLLDSPIIEEEDEELETPKHSTKSTVLEGTIACLFISFSKCHKSKPI